MHLEIWTCSVFVKKCSKIKRIKKDIGNIICENVMNDDEMAIFYEIGHRTMWFLLTIIKNGWISLKKGWHIFINNQAIYKINKTKELKEKK